MSGPCNRHAPVCVCGCIRFEYRLTQFPMAWRAVCRRCGTEHPTQRVGLKLGKTTAKPPAPRPPYDGGWYDDFGYYHG